jgi:MFS transporter, OFA family, oxalate/formate antiporter
MMAGARRETVIENRWLQLVAGVTGMVMIANLQYGWTLFVNPIDAKYHWGKAAIQVAFSIFVLTETWLVPFEAYLVDRYGPALMVAIGGVLVGGAWATNSLAASLSALYIAAAVGGVGAGIVYGTTVGNALKWFPDRRGLAAGLTAAGFGAGSALTVVPIANMIRASGYESTFWYFGIGQGAAVVLIALVMRAPSQAAVAAVARQNVQQTGRDVTPLEMVRTPAFLLLYAMFTMVATGGLMAVAQLAPMARDFQVAEVPVSLFGLTMAALPFALSLDRVLNGLTRPFLAGSRTISGAKTRCSSRFWLKPRESACSCSLLTSRSCSSSCRAWCSLPGGRSIASSPPSRPTSSVAGMRPPTMGSSTRRRGPPPCWFPSGAG